VEISLLHHSPSQEKLSLNLPWDRRRRSENNLNLESKSCFSVEERIENPEELSEDGERG